MTLRRMLAAACLCCLAQPVPAQAPPPPGGQSSVQAVPRQQSVLATVDTVFNVVWRVEVPPGLLGATSPSGVIVRSAGSGTELATPGGPLSSGGTGVVQFTETVTLDRATASSLAEQGQSFLLYRRSFFDTGNGVPLGEAAVVLRLSESGLRAGREPASASLGIQRLMLSFESEAPIALVEAGSTLVAKLTVNYAGGGVLEGSWQVADPASTQGLPLFRVLKELRQPLVAGQRVELPGPELPTDTPGRYLLRFCVTRPLPDGPVPAGLEANCPSELLQVTLPYQVAGAADPLAMSLRLRSPPDGAIGSGAAFAWSPVPAATVYRLQIFSAPAEDGEIVRPAAARSPEFVTGILLPPAETESRLSALVREQLQSGRRYLWRVTAHDGQGRMIARSDEGWFRLSPRDEMP